MAVVAIIILFHLLLFTLFPSPAFKTCYYRRFLFLSLNILQFERSIIYLNARSNKPKILNGNNTENGLCEADDLASWILM